MAAPDRLPGGFSRPAQVLVHAALSAGEIGMRYFRRANRSWTKAGNSPVSEADIAVDRHLREAIQVGLPQSVFISEEDEEARDIPEVGMAVIADPIDGTRGFIAGNANWAVAIALLENLRTVAGVVYCPALGRLFAAQVSTGVFVNGEPLDAPRGGELRRLTGSRKINAELAEKYGDRYEIVDFIPSLACRLVMVAHGEIDAAFARPGAHVWDVAAAGLVLAKSGASLVTLSGEPWQIATRATRAPALIAASAANLPAALALAKSSRILQ